MHSDITTVNWHWSPLEPIASFSRRPDENGPRIARSKLRVTVPIPKDATVHLVGGYAGVETLTWPRGSKALKFEMMVRERGNCNEHYEFPRRSGIKYDAACGKEPKHSSATAESTNTIMDPRPNARFLHNDHGYWNCLTGSIPLHK